MTRPDLIVVSNDDTGTYGPDGFGLEGAGNDSVSIVDITDRAKPRIVADLSLTNTITGPPTNVQITPDGRLALVASSLRYERVGGEWTSPPDDKVYVIDLQAEPPRHIHTVSVGRQPSGVSISRKGDLALVANRAGNSVSVLAIDGVHVSHVGDVPMGHPVADVTISPDGTRAFAAKSTVHRVAFLRIDGTKVDYDADLDMPAGYGVFNVKFALDGRIALAANQGPYADGHVDTITVIDALANPPRTIDHVTVGDTPEGLAVSPDGRYAISVLMKGTGARHDHWAYTKHGGVLLIRVEEDRTLTLLNELPAGGVPEAVTFSPDGEYVYVGNFIEHNMQVFRIVDDRLVDTGTVLALPGGPAAIGSPAR